MDTTALAERLAQEIRRVDGSHSLGAAALADALVPFVESLRAVAGEPVAWPDRMVNLPCPDGSTDRILGFRIPEGDPILGEFGLSEPLAWLRRVTVERPQPATPASGWTLTFDDPRDFCLAVSPLIGAAYNDPRAAACRINTSTAISFGKITATPPASKGGDHEAAL